MYSVSSGLVSVYRKDTVLSATSIMTGIESNDGSSVHGWCSSLQHLLRIYPPFNLNFFCLLSTPHDLLCRGSLLYEASLKSAGFSLRFPFFLSF